MIILYVILRIKHCPAKMMNKCVPFHEKNALIHKIKHLMTVLGILLFSPVYYWVINTYLFEKGDMKL